MSLSTLEAGTAADQFGCLGQLVRTLPEGKFLAVLKQLSNFTELSAVVDVMEEIRPRLRTLRPPRPHQLRRLLCEPFEDLLYSANPQNFKQTICRQTIRECWSLVIGYDSSALEKLNKELTSIPTTDLESVFALGLRLWKFAARALGEASDSRVSASGAISLAAIRKALSAAEEIQRFKQRFPAKPLLRLSTAEITAINNTISELRVKQVGIEGYLTAIIARMEQPSELISLLQKQEFEIDPKLLQSFGLLAQADVDDRLFRLQDYDKETSPELLIRNAEQLLGAIVSTKNVLGGTARTDLDQRSKSMIVKIRNIMSDGIIAPAQSIIEQVMPSSDSEEAISDEKILAADSQARALGRARRIAGQVGLEAQVSQTINSIQKKAESQIAKLISDSCAMGHSSEDSEASIFRSIRIIELMDNAQEAQRLFKSTSQQLARLNNNR